MLATTLVPDCISHFDYMAWGSSQELVQDCLEVLSQQLSLTEKTWIVPLRPVIVAKRFTKRPIF